MDQQRLDAIRARIDEFDRHKDASMNERDPETHAYIRAFCSIRKTAVEDERDMLAEIDRLTAELAATTAERDYWKNQFGELAEAHGNLTADRNAQKKSADEWSDIAKKYLSSIAEMGEDRDAWRKRAEESESDKDALFAELCCQKKRAEAAEADLNHIAQEMFSDNSDDLRGDWYPCEVCAEYKSGDDCWDCLAASYDRAKPGAAFKWRGPVEGGIDFANGPDYTVYPDGRIEANPNRKDPFEGEEAQHDGSA